MEKANDVPKKWHIFTKVKCSFCQNLVNVEIFSGTATACQRIFKKCRQKLVKSITKMFLKI